ncbi:inner membrane protein YpjD [Hahella sp. HN01]|uniref:cytochrome C assembly family protein n=1 Tax=Hahella sp. HN01 TaxID=2847262 RepID=UPI001C1E9ED0|nr:cytochrome c biogenesis protein CcsA [Hahella sp. HN01]MBU6953752.1 cytochrome c biogenesis protein CcsA [Hahella sp. HN01]
MSVVTLSIVATVFYTVATAFQYAVYEGKTPQRPHLAGAIGFLAVAAHAVSVWLLSSTSLGADFGFFKIISIISLFLSALIVSFAYIKPVHNLKLLIYPIAIITVIAAVSFKGPTQVVEPGHVGLMAHITLSVIAYSVFSLAGLQALLLYAQNKQLKSHMTGRLVKALPPLQTTEDILFEMIWTGLILLTLAIITGSFFVEDLFAQHLVHKTALSILSWLIFALLAVGRNLWGWRGLLAARLTIGGCLLLALGFLGSKIALEFIIQPKI